MKSLFDSEEEAEAECVKFRKRAVKGMLFKPIRVDDGWVIEQDCTEQYARDIHKRVGSKVKW